MKRRFHLREVKIPFRSDSDVKTLFAVCFPRSFPDPVSCSSLGEMNFGEIFEIDIYKQISHPSKNIQNGD